MAAKKRTSKTTTHKAKVRVRSVKRAIAGKSGRPAALEHTKRVGTKKLRKQVTERLAERETKPTKSEAALRAARARRRNKGLSQGGFKKGSRHPGSCTDQDVKEIRHALIRNFLARGLYQHEIIAECQGNEWFMDARQFAAREPLSRGTIKKIILATQREIREQTILPEDEIPKAYERMMYAHRTAAMQGDVGGMAKVQRELARMLGLRKEPLRTQDMEVQTIRAQLAAMYKSVPVPEDASSQEGQCSEVLAPTLPSLTDLDEPMETE